VRVSKVRIVATVMNLLLCCAANRKIWVDVRCDGCEVLERVFESYERLGVMTESKKGYGGAPK
jgi:hypothetical protein